jgi:hypothetical protein
MAALMSASVALESSNVRLPLAGVLANDAETTVSASNVAHAIGTSRLQFMLITAQ